MLAGIIASPDVYSPPRLVAKNRDDQQAEAQVAEDRRNLVLAQHARRRATSPRRSTSTTRAHNSRCTFEIEPPSDDSIAPYFTSWLRQQLVDKYGAGEAFGGGLVVKSTLDLELPAAGRGPSSRHA